MIDDVLVIEDLSVAYRGGGDAITALDGVDLTLREGHVLAVVGESGSGKSTLVAATLGLLPPAASVSGRVIVTGTDVVGATERTRRSLRGRAMTLVPQDSGASLNPVVPVVEQVAEIFRVHRRLGRQQARAAAAARLAAMGIDQSVVERGLLPDELSGGMRQRALLALATALDPPLVVADEPTAHLDPPRTLEVLALFRRLALDGSAVMLVTHDLGVASTATSVVVLYGGRVMEDGPAAAVLGEPRHPYTRALVAARPSLRRAGYRARPIAGAPPERGGPSRGCPFAPRCPEAIERCHSARPATVAVSLGHVTACHLVEPTRD